jgi:uncharacterized protein (TIGR00290 family)
VVGVGLDLTTADELMLLAIEARTGCPTEEYEERLATALAGDELDGIERVAFGDLFLEDVRTHREEHLSLVGKHGLFPLWGQDTKALARDMIANGFRALVVCVDPQALDASFAGRAFDSTFLHDLPTGVDPCGENGEFHTFVWAAPMYRSPIPCRTGEMVIRDGFAFCDVIPA